MGSLKSRMELTITRDVDCGFGITDPMTIRVTQVSNDTLAGITADNESQAYAEAICRMVPKWEMLGPVPMENVGDLVEGSIVEADKPIPLEPEIVKHLPLPLLKGIVMGIWEAADPKRPASRSTKETAD